MSLTDVVDWSANKDGMYPTRSEVRSNHLQRLEKSVAHEPHSKLKEGSLTIKLK